MIKVEVRLLDNYFSFDESEPVERRKYLVVVIYDITETKRRTRLVKYLKSFGFRVQKSAFECTLDARTHKKLISGIGKYVINDDLLRVYRLAGNTDVQVWGDVRKTEIEDVIIV